MGDTRFARFYHEVKDAEDPAASIRSLTDEGVISALAAASRDANPYLANVLASEALNRARLKGAVMNTLGEGVYAVSRDGRLTYLNPAAERLLAVEARQVLGADIHLLIHPPDAPPVPEPCALVLALNHGESVRADDAVFVTADGSLLAVSFVSTPLLREGELDGAVVAFQDIRARKAAEERLKRSERSLAVAQQIAHVGSWEWELATGRISWSDEMFRIHGLSTQEAPITPESYLQFVPPAERPIIQRQLEERMRNPMPFEQERRVTLPNGAVRHIHYRGDVLVDSEGRASRFIGTAQDVTSRKLAEERLASLLADREGIMESIPDVLFRLDPEGRIVAWNRRLVEATGHDAERLWMLPLATLIPGDERGRMEESLQRCSREGEVSAECGLLRSDGSSAPHDWRWVALRAREGGLAGFIGVARDATDRLRAQEALVRSNERFRLLARATRDTAYDWNLEDGSLWWNDNIWRLTRREPGSVEPHIGFWKSQIHVEDRERVIGSLEAALDGGGEAWSDEYRFARADGTYARVLDRAFIMRDGGRATRLVGAMMDLGAARSRRFGSEA